LAAKLRAVRWKSSVLGVAPPALSEAKRADVPGLGAANMGPIPPGVKPDRIDDSLGVGKLPLKWCVSLK
jgi:hypothetical protein